MWYTYQSILHYLSTYEDEGGGGGGGGGGNGDSATSKGSIGLSINIGL